MAITGLTRGEAEKVVDVLRDILIGGEKTEWLTEVRIELDIRGESDPVIYTSAEDEDGMTHDYRLVLHGDGSIEAVELN